MDSAPVISKNVSKKSTQFSNNEIDDLHAQIARLRQLDEIKDEFINIASHELKNLVQPILLFAELAKNGDTDKDRAIDIILANANKLRQLTSDILDASRIENERFVCEMGRVTINDLVAEVIQATKLRLSPKVSLETSYNIDDGSEKLVIDGDRVKLTQLLTNLINNAVKFTVEGSIMIKLYALVEQNQLEVLVSDTGRGIPVEVMAHLFERFIPKSAAQGNKQGAGLGLYISRAIVSGHHGEISALNNSNGGATIRVLLPIRQQNV